MQDTGGESVLTGLLVAPVLPRDDTNAPREHPYMPQLRAVLAEEASITLVRAKKLANPAKISKSLVAEVTDVGFVLADLSRHAPSVYVYLGLAKALGKTIVVLRRPDKTQVKWLDRFVDVVVDYDAATEEGLVELGHKLRDVFRTLLRAEALDHQVLMGDYSEGVGITELEGDEESEKTTLDFSPLSAVEHENLCHELLLADGMEQITWLDEMSEVTMMALRPAEKGHHDLFLISIGGGLDDDITVQMWGQDFHGLFPRISKIAEERQLRRAEGKIVLNLLFISSHDAASFAVATDFQQALFARIDAIGGQTFTVRSTIWNRRRLESLVRQRPILVRKYFTSEWRDAASEVRKSSEELYRDALELAERAAFSARNLEKKYGVDPGKKWQDLAYTATHSIGNAIFPVETYIDYLRELTEEIGHEEGKLAAERAWTNIEKAKVHIRKFKSIASSKEHWNLKAIDLVPRLASSLETARAHGVAVNTFYEEHPSCFADADVVDEILDELVSNSFNWQPKDEAPRLTVTLKIAGEDDLPPRLADSPSKFLWLRFEDNGQGVAQDQKEKIFDLFYSKSFQGMGFGLSIVRKGMRAFGGEVVETGTPGLGACFDLFFQIATTP